MEQETARTRQIVYEFWSKLTTLVAHNRVRDLGKTRKAKDAKGRAWVSPKH
jgi:hypothetical protein